MILNSSFRLHLYCKYSYIKVILIFLLVVKHIKVLRHWSCVAIALPLAVSTAAESAHFEMRKYHLSHFLVLLCSLKAFLHLEAQLAHHLYLLSCLFFLHFHFLLRHLSPALINRYNIFLFFRVPCETANSRYASPAITLSRRKLG